MLEGKKWNYTAPPNTTWHYLFAFRNVDPPIWYDTDVKLFEIQRVWMATWYVTGT